MEVVAWGTSKLDEHQCISLKTLFVGLLSLIDPANEIFLNLVEKAVSVARQGELRDV